MVCLAFQIAAELARLGGQLAGLIRLLTGQLLGGMRGAGFGAGWRGVPFDFTGLVRGAHQILFCPLQRFRQIGNLLRQVRGRLRKILRRLGGR